MPAITKPERGYRALRRGRLSLEGHVYHVTTTTSRRKPLFADFATARIAVRALNEPAHRGHCTLIAWVLMPDHLHVLLRLTPTAALEGTVSRLKSAIARASNRHLGRSGAFWQGGFHDHLIRDGEDLRAVARYIVMNPLRAGLVARVSGYPHWDAIWL
ncbi:MAG TPA: transposase [Verrucomicrobiae bacterium]|nr:transposase [Verrucomicrobiae bacterium]